MRTREWLAALEDLPFGSLGDLVGTDPFLVLAPHPDDEALGCGGLIAAATIVGTPAHVLVLTDGSASHRNSATYPPAKLAALRQAESRAAVARLGLPPDALAFLGLPDAAAPTSGEAFEAAVEAIVGQARRVGARALFVSSGHDPHCDHVAAFDMARAAAPEIGAKLWAYPIWSLHRDLDDTIEADDARGLRLDITPWIAAKRAALACYASQMTRLVADDPDGFVFEPAELAPFLRSVETFLEVDG